MLETPWKGGDRSDESANPPILKLILDNVRKPPSPKEREAGRLFALGQLTIAEYIAALNDDAAMRR